MNDYFFTYLLRTIKREYIAPKSIDGRLRNLWRKTDKISEEQALREFIPMLKSMKPRPQAESNTYKSDIIPNMLGDFRPATILDIGAGITAWVVEELGKHYSLPKSEVYAIDIAPIQNSNVTTLKYAEDGRIPLPDQSVDLVVLMSVLHHVNPDNRHKILSEAQRVLRPNGRLYIREHDNSGTYQFRIFIQLYHYIYYVRFGEDYDDLYLMSKPELEELVAEYGFSEMNNNYQPTEKKVQRIYDSVFIRS